MTKKNLTHILEIDLKNSDHFGCNKTLPKFLLNKGLTIFWKLGFTVSVVNYLPLLIYYSGQSDFAIYTQTINI